MALLLEVICLSFFLIIFEAVCFIHMKLLVEQAFSHEFVFDRKAFKKFDEFRMC